jgi:two-component system, cell cycle response regulator DivK
MSPQTILVVEDDHDNRRIYRDILQWAGYEVLEAPDGQTGVEMARRHVPDLILMDISMPKLDGWSAIELLKQDPVTTTIPAMVLTAHVSLNGERDQAKALGCEAYLVKPIRPKDLLWVVCDRLGPSH